MNLCIYMIDHRAAGVMFVFVGIYFVIALLLYSFKRPAVMGEMVRFAAGYGQVQTKLLKEMAVPYGIMDVTGRLLWANDEFKDALELTDYRKSMKELFPEITPDDFPTIESDTELHFTITVGKEEKNYKIQMRVASVTELDESMLWSTEENGVSEENMLIALYLYDETENIALQKENQDQRLITGLLYIDNYEEALESIDEVRRSLLTALVDRKINKYM